MQVFGVFHTRLGVLIAALCLLAGLSSERVNFAAADTAPAPLDLNAPVVASVGHIDFRECNLTAEARERRVQCATLTVRENPADAESRTIDVFIVRLPAKRASAQAQDPMLLLAGGPGQAASEAFLFADQSFAALAKNRDFYLIDQRGTGRSNYLGCDEVASEADMMLLPYSSARIKQMTEGCLASLDADLTRYTTAYAIEDFEQVRKALGVTAWNLLGVSYGTRVASHYMRAHPSRVRTAVLDSVVPPEKPLGPEIALQSEASFTALLARCAANPACAERMPGLGEHVHALFARLKTAPVTVAYENFSTGDMATMDFSHAHLAALVRLYLYNTHSVALLPPMLQAAAVNHNFAPLARASAKLLTQLRGKMSAGLHNTVLCSEDVPFYNYGDALLEATAQTYMGTDLLQAIHDVCAVWPQANIPENFRAPLQTAVPTLLFSGEFDPITPPAYADMVLPGLTQAKHLVLPGQGHFVSASGCAPDLVENFVSNRSIERLNPACLQRLRAAPLFVNFNGPAP